MHHPSCRRGFLCQFWNTQEKKETYIDDPLLRVPTGVIVLLTTCLGFTESVILHIVLHQRESHNENPIYLIDGLPASSYCPGTIKVLQGIFFKQTAINFVSHSEFS